MAHHRLDCTSLRAARWPCVAGLLMLVTLGACGAPLTVAPLTPEDVPRLQQVGNFPERIYRIEPGDTLSIRYPFHHELDQPEVTVEPDGKIMATRVGSVVVEGLMTAELERLLQERTSTYLRDPEVVVTVKKFAEKPVYVGGEVHRPGVVAYRKGLTPLMAVIAAGGILDTGRVDSVILIRTAQDNTLIARRVDLSQTIADGLADGVQVAPHDVIYVPKSPIANANLWVRQHIIELIPFFRTSVPLPPR